MKNFLILLLFLSYGAFAQSVRLETDTKVYAGAGKDHLMILDVGTEGATTSSNANRVYIPMRDDQVQDGATTASNTNFTILSPSSTIPWFKQEESSNNSRVRQTLRISSLNGTDSYLFAGLLKSGGDELIVIPDYSTIGNVSRNGLLIGKDQGVVTTTYSVGIHQICSIVEAGCDPITYDSDNIQKHVIEPVIYFFLATQAQRDNIQTNPVIKLSEVEDGTYFKYALSNTIDLGEDLAVLENLIKGDARLKVEYSGQKITQMNDIIGIVYDATPTGAEWPQQSYADAVAAGGVINSKGNEVVVPGDLFVKNLTNYQEYWVGVAFVNKWYFATLVSETKNEMPERIEAFLEAKQCYLISAGFKKDHYVLDFYRSIRDQILMKSSWGKRFVEFYYNTAPKYAQIIWHNEILSKFVRVFAYLGYFLMRYFPAMALVILLGFIIRKLWPTYR